MRREVIASPGNIYDSRWQDKTVDFGVSLICAAFFLKCLIDSLGIRVWDPGPHRGILDSEALIMDESTEFFSLFVGK